jgi:HSP20 family protein
MAEKKEKEKEPESTVATERGDGRKGARARRGASAPALWGGGPFGAMRRFAEEMDRTFEDFGFGRGLLSPWGSGRWRGMGLDEGMWSPTVEVFQRDDRLVVRADLPGLTKDDVQVEVTDDALTIRGERRHEHEEHREGYYHSERSYGSFRRRIPLPEGADAGKADAHFHDGVLEVTLLAPRAATQARRLEVKG